MDYFFQCYIDESKIRFLYVLSPLNSNATVSSTLAVTPGELAFPDNEISVRHGNKVVVIVGGDGDDKKVGEVGCPKIV